MPRRLIGILGFLLVFAGKLWAQGEIVLSVGNVPVSRAEFQYAFQRSRSADWRKFVTCLVEHKLKVCAARAAGVDTSSAFRASWQLLRPRLRRNFEVDAVREEQALYRLYQRGEQRLRNNRWVRVAHISLYLPQQGGGNREKQALHLMDSLYYALQDGADFATLARRYSDDRFAAEHGGVLPWMPVNKNVQEWIVQLDELACNQVSRPFFSPLGIHLVKWIDRKEGLSFEECRSHLSHFREGHGVVERRCLSPEEETACRLEEQLVYEGLLVAYVDCSQSSSQSSFSERDLKRFFEQHRKRYSWEFPHYRGAVLAGTDKKLVKRLRKYLKKLPFEQWEKAARKWMEEHPSDHDLQVKVGLFPIGSQPAVDKLVYKCGDFMPSRQLPVVQVLGKNLKNGPESWEDVRETVVRDFRLDQKTAWMKALREKYRVEINEEVLKTVNIDGNR